MSIFVHYDTKENIRLKPREGGITSGQKSFITSLLIKGNDRYVIKDEVINNFTREEASQIIDKWKEICDYDEKGL